MPGGRLASGANANGAPFAVSDAEAYEALSTVMEDEDTFQLVVDTVFQDMDVNGNAELEAHEMGHFLARVCARFGIDDPPNANQVAHVFHHLDLDGDNTIERAELETFLRHLFNEHLRKLEPQHSKKNAPNALAAALASSKPKAAASNPLLARIRAAKK